ncbi:hypothetical protein SAMN05216464_110221 [Mucilaginibacter pineti]|uniref:Uncharacterized protein n=1 Tax=Mucilaginibacter pineti TaxID=1391627 RepID=A0A1G7GNG9_9SPHI|nr:hypothetical protein [Mucilaginibacter pineti]SDE89539.1 hypothetical protein SAMN05216464_110221 [Mucilaginibacter pineti]
MAIIANISITNASTTDDIQVYGDVYISLTNAAGNPVNGNFVEVTYTENINGTISNKAVNIPGQSLKIFSGLLSNETSGYFVSFTTPKVATVPATPPPTHACDMVINFINIDKQESVAGAADAQVTVHATSSYGPIMYSKDLGSTWQLSPVFSGLSYGLVQIMAKDSNPLGCTDQLSVNINTLSGLLVDDPSVTLTGGNVSRWSAAFNPIVFIYQRKDFAVHDVTQAAGNGFAQVAVNTAFINLTNSVPKVFIGDTVYINAGPYKGVYTIVGISIFSIVINTAFAGNATGFININRLRPYHKVITKLTYMDKLTGRQNTITSTNRPNNEGIVRADLSNFLQSLLRPADDSSYTQTNFRDDNLSASYQLQYIERYDGDNLDENNLIYTTIANPYYVVYAARQLGQQYGGNLAAYVPFAHVTDPTQLARWVTDFNEPAYSIGYPFDISFIYSEEMVGLQLYCELTLLDINRNPLGGPQASYLLNDDGSWLLNQDGGKFIIANQTQVNTPVPAQLGLNRLMINGNFPREAYYFTIALKYDDEHTSHTVTQTQTVRIDDAVDDNSVYLRWIGLSGSWNYYRFVYNQEVSLDVQNATIIKNFVSDWENQQGIEEVISKTAGQKMKVMAEDLKVTDIKGLQSIKYSPKVQMLVNKNPVKWQTIVINTATYSEYETHNGQAPFSLTFNMPSINIQTQ